MIRIIQRDMTTLAVDAIVDAANQVILGGGGVDGVIYRAAWHELYEACLKVLEVRPGVRCPTGEASITPDFKLPAKFVIHTVGPVYRYSQHGEPEKLEACYRNSLALAAENDCKFIAFPLHLDRHLRLPQRRDPEDCSARGAGVFISRRERGAGGRLSSCAEW